MMLKFYPPQHVPRPPSSYLRDEGSRIYSE